MPPKSSKTSPKPCDDVASLLNLFRTTQVLLFQFVAPLETPLESTKNVTALKPAPQNSLGPQAAEVPPLDVLRDAATLTKAHTTKLTLLATTPPLTPSALARELCAITNICIPSMLSAVETLSQKPGADTDSAPRKYPEALYGRARACVARVLRGLTELVVGMETVVEEGQKDSSSLNEKKPQSGKKSGKGEKKEGSTLDSFSSTGVVWDSCDALIELARTGVAGVVAVRAKELRDQLEDALGELKEWGDEADEEGEDEDEDDIAHESDQDSMDDFLGTSNRLPKSNKELRALLEKSLKKLRLISTLYQALIKRRLKTFPVSPNTEDTAARLDGLMEALKSIPDAVDELASAFYDLDSEEARRFLDLCCSNAIGATAIAKKSWDAKKPDDQFTGWADKWVEAIRA